MAITTFIDSPRLLPDGQVVINAKFVDDTPGVKPRTPEVFITVFTLEGVKAALRTERDKAVVSESFFKLIQPGEIDLTPAVVDPTDPDPEAVAKEAYIEAREALRRALANTVNLGIVSADDQLIKDLRSTAVALFKSAYVSL